MNCLLQIRYILLPFLFLVVSCTSLPDAESFIAPCMEGVEVTESGCFGVKLRCGVDFAQWQSNKIQLGSGGKMEYGFYLFTNKERVDIPASRSGNSIVADVEGLSSGSVYECVAYIRMGEYEKLSGREEVKTNDPFKDKNFKAYIIDNFDTDRDGGISKREAIVVDTISVVTDNIIDLAGVEVFEDLYYLYCAGISDDKFKFDKGIEGVLQHLDISENTKLEFLNCGHNKLTELNVSNNLVLRYLDCNNTLITSLDISKNYNLENLEGHDCEQLTDVKYPQGGNLRSAFMHNCNFTSVDISALKYLDSFNCAHSEHLTHLDFSGNKYMRVLGVAALPLIEELDLSKNEFVADIDCDNCSSLKVIYLHKNAKLYNFVKPEHVQVLYVEP